jgi:hypothetical protein
VIASGVRIPYITFPRCDAYPGLTDIESLGWTMSHEYVESTTDPFETAYWNVDADHQAWSFLPNFVEMADICNYPFLLARPSDLGYTVQRVWSNEAAAASQDPCVPAPAGQVYFNSAPVLDDDVSIGSTASSTSITKGVHIPVGQTRTIELDLFSMGPTTGPWHVEATDWTTDPAVCVSRSCGAPALQLALDRDSGSNGDKLHLTITVLHRGAIGGSRFLLKSTLAGYTTFWVGYVGN